jgi:hypothetical protein
MDDSVSRSIMTSSAALYQNTGFWNITSRTVGSRSASFLVDAVQSGEFPKGNNRADLDESLKAWRQDKWKRIRGLGLRFAMLLMLGVGVRTPLARRGWLLGIFRFWKMHA